MLGLQLLQVQTVGTMKASGSFEDPLVELNTDEHGQPAIRVEEAQVEFLLVFPHFEAVEAFIDSVVALRGALLPKSA
ncbi:MAG: hypothetical protein H6740_28615 [Alphaproteobacteria bacterium]|nr:hypothetical protein [Alphaproteobacteria bacterium]